MSRRHFNLLLSSLELSLRAESEFLSFSSEAIAT